jgi:hypothetical protein
MAYPKIKITKQQEAALKEWTGYNRGDKGEKFEHFVNNRHTFDNVYKPLANFDVPEFALILSGHYEVVNDFHVGDWVKSKVSKVYYKVREHVGEDRGMFIGNINANYHDFEKVESPLEIKLLEGGRQRPTLMPGDVIQVEGGGVMEVYITRIEGSIHDHDDVIAVYPAESRLTK